MSHRHRVRFVGGGPDYYPEWWDLKTILYPQETPVLPFPRFYADNRPREQKAQEVFYEAASDLSDAYTKNQWTSFQHYKRWRGGSNPMLGQTFYSLSDTYGFTAPNKATCACRYYDPYWGWRTSSSTSLHVHDPWRAFTAHYDPTEADGFFVKPPVQLESLIQRSLNAMMPGIKPDLSLVNSLIELKDLLTLKTALTGIKNLVLSLPNRLRNSKIRTFRAMTREAAKGHLQYAFNLKPLYSDIMGVYTSIRDYKARVNELRSRAGKRQKRHFTCTLIEGIPNESTRTQTLGPDVPGKLYPRVGASKCTMRSNPEPSKFHAQIEYTYVFSRFENQFAGILGLLDSLGVTNDPSIIWNALPWTFVIDWVVNVSSWLKQFRTRGLEPQVCIHRYLWSISRKRRIDSEFFITMNPLQPSGFCPVRSFEPIFETAYCRQVGLPERSWIETSGLNSNEFILGSSLALSRVRT